MPQFIERTTTERDISCKYCGNTELFKNGKGNGKQYYLCERCGHRATGSNTYPKVRYDKDTINRGMTYYYNGMSFQGVKNTFDDLDNMKIAKSTLFEWIGKYTKIVIPYVEENKPTKIGDEWYADETMIMMYGKNKWLWSVIDQKTRYLLACRFTANRMTKDATALFYDAYCHAGKKPKTIYTDKLFAYLKAFNKVFYSRYKKDRVTHLKSEGFGSSSNINLIERWHEYVKQRTKIMRHFKKKESAFVILQGIIINYNYLWEHSYLKNRVPAEVAGIDIKGLEIKNWGNLIDLALKYQKIRPNPKEFTWYMDERKRVMERINV